MFGKVISISISFSKGLYVFKIIVKVMSDDKSFIAKIEESILKLTKPDYMDDYDKIIEFLSKKQNAKPVKSVFKSIDFEGMQVFTFGDENAKNTIDI